MYPQKCGEKNLTKQLKMMHAQKYGESKILLNNLKLCVLSNRLKINVIKKLAMMHPQKC